MNRWSCLEYYNTQEKILQYTRENTTIHKRKYYNTQEKILQYTRENTTIHKRKYYNTQEKILQYTRELTLWFFAGKKYILEHTTIHKRKYYNTQEKILQYTRENTTIHKRKDLYSSKYDILGVYNTFKSYSLIHPFNPTTKSITLPSTTTSLLFVFHFLCLDHALYSQFWACQ